MHTQSLQQQGWERGGRQGEQLGCRVWKACRARLLCHEITAWQPSGLHLQRGDSSSQAICQHQEGADKSMNPTLISANVPSTRALSKGCLKEVLPVVGRSGCTARPSHH